MSRLRNTVPVEPWCDRCRIPSCTCWTLMWQMPHSILYRYLLNLDVTDAAFLLVHVEPWCDRCRTPSCTCWTLVWQMPHSFLYSSARLRCLISTCFFSCSSDRNSFSHSLQTDLIRSAIGESGSGWCRFVSFKGCLSRSYYTIKTD